MFSATPNFAETRTTPVAVTPFTFKATMPTPTPTMFSATPNFAETRTTPAAPFTFKATSAPVTTPVTTLNFESVVPVTQLLDWKKSSHPKIKGLILLMSVDPVNSFESMNNAITNHVFSVENIWTIGLFDEPKTFTGVINGVDSSLVKLLHNLMDQLMVESIQTPDQLFSWLQCFAVKHDNKQMLCLFALLKLNLSEEDFLRVVNPHTHLEHLTWALHTFVRYDNFPVKTLEHVVKSDNSLYKTFALTLVGSSYHLSFCENTKDLGFYEASKCVVFGKTSLNLEQLTRLV
jgi:hypothetical protein